MQAMNAVSDLINFSEQHGLSHLDILHLQCKSAELHYPIVSFMSIVSYKLQESILRLKLRKEYMTAGEGVILEKPNAKGLIGTDIFTFYFSKVAQST